MNFLDHSTGLPTTSGTAYISRPLEGRRTPDNKSRIPRSKPPVLMLELHLRRFMRAYEVLPSANSDVGLALTRKINQKILGRGDEACGEV